MTLELFAPGVMVNSDAELFGVTHVLFKTRGGWRCRAEALEPTTPTSVKDIKSAAKVISRSWARTSHAETFSRRIFVQLPLEVLPGIKTANVDIATLNGETVPAGTASSTLKNVRRDLGIAGGSLGPPTFRVMRERVRAGLTARRRWFERLL